jgi:DNA-binding LytR/AlgR family response regulator
MLNALIVDDEAPAHTVLLHHCGQIPDVTIVAQCFSAAEALEALRTHRIDLMFLDINMPRFGGLDLLRGLDPRPLTIIVSGHREHALEGYDLDVVDYLLKPVSEDRFVSAIVKARRRLSPAQDRTPARDIAIKIGRSTRLFKADEIACLEAHGNFVRIWSDRQDKPLATATLQQLESELKPLGFVRVHRSFVVNRARIIEQNTREVTLDIGITVPIGKSFKGAVPLP